MNELDSKNYDSIYSELKQKVNRRLDISEREDLENGSEEKSEKDEFFQHKRRSDKNDSRKIF